MLEDELVSCPKCNKELNVKVMRTGVNPTYLVPTECPNCKTAAEKIEKILNSFNRKRKHHTIEKSYLRVFDKPK